MRLTQVCSSAGVPYRFPNAVNWRKSAIEIGRPELRVHDLRHTYASLSRRAGADLRLLQKAMGHASITVTAHTYADLFDDELDDIATALDSLDDFHKGSR
jgi:integrase